MLNFKQFVIERDDRTIPNQAGMPYAHKLSPYQAQGQAELAQVMQKREMVKEKITNAMSKMTTQPDDVPGIIHQLADPNTGYLKKFSPTLLKGLNYFLAEYEKWQNTKNQINAEQNQWWYNHLTQILKTALDLFSTEVVRHPAY